MSLPSVASPTPAVWPHPWLAREGWPFVAAGLAAALGATAAFGPWAALPFWVVLLFLVQFFRDPVRPVAGGANAVVSPADGRVVRIDRTRDPYTARDALAVSVFMNVFDVHSNRAPVDGTVVRVEYHRGRFVNASLDKASGENERNAVVLRLANGELVSVVQVAGLIARRILCYVKVSDRVARGQRYGFIRFGSRVDVFLPLHARARVAVGDPVRAASTVLAEL